MTKYIILFIFNINNKQKYNIKELNIKLVNFLFIITI